MSTIFALYGVLFLAALVTFLYAALAYYECPQTRSHRPYIFPIFASIGWVLLALQGLTGQTLDKHSTAGLTLVTLLAIIILLHNYRKVRQGECRNEQKHT
jgi:heme A synthase